MKLSTFITNNVAKINEYKADYIAGNNNALKMPLQEFFSKVSTLTGLLREYDLADIKDAELGAAITADSYTSAYDKQRDEVEQKYNQAQKYLLNKEEDKLKAELAELVTQIDTIKGA